MTWTLIAIIALGMFVPDVWVAVIGDEWAFLWGVAAALFAGGVLTGRHVFGWSWRVSFFVCVGALIAAAVAVLVAAVQRGGVDPE